MLSKIGEALHLSVDAVKTHLHALFEKFGVRHLSISCTVIESVRGWAAGGTQA